MTAEELIIGHYEKTLTVEQESRLASLVTSSPEVRSLYEQHGNIHGVMVEEAERIETSSKLDKVVLGAALGTLAEIAGHGVGFSLLGKVASIVGAVAVGGVGIILYNTMTDSDDAAQNSPVPASTQVRGESAPTMPSSQAPLEARDDAATPSPNPATPSATSSPVQLDAHEDRATTDVARDAQTDARGRSGSQAVTRSSTDTGTARSRPPIDLHPDSPQATIRHAPEVRP